MQQGFDKRVSVMNNLTLYAITVIIWGSTWIAITYQLGTVAPEVSLVYRFGLAAIVMWLFCWFKRLPMKFSVIQHIQLMFFGATLFGGNYFFLYQGQQYINSALACIAFSSIMFLNIVNARVWFKTKITSQVLMGAVIGVAGMVILFWPDITNNDLGQSTAYGIALCLTGAAFASSGNMISIRNSKKSIPVTQASTLGMTYGTIAMLILALIQGKHFNFDFSVSYVTSLIYLSIFGSVIAFATYLTLLERIGAHKASYATIMFPAVAVLISSVVENFQWSTYTIIGLSLVVLGNVVVLNKPKKKGQKPISDF